MFWKLRKQHKAESSDADEEFFRPTYGLSVEQYIVHGDMQGLHHLARYQWAALVLGQIPPARLLDCASGAGYGSKILADALPSTQVLGVDYDTRGTVLSRAHYSASNLTYMTGDLVRWSLSDGSGFGEFDCIVSFDTLEHLLHREIAMMNIAQHLQPDGILLFSTPCGHAETLLNPGWEHHKIEYAYPDLFDFLHRYFAEVIHPACADFPFAEFWRDVVNKDEPRYLTLMNPVVCRKPIHVRRLAL